MELSKLDRIMNSDAEITYPAMFVSKKKKKKKKSLENYLITHITIYSCDWAYDSQEEDCCDCDNDSQRFEEEFERVLQLIFPRLPFPLFIIRYSILDGYLPNTIWNPFREHCVKTGEKMDSLCQKDGLLKYQWNRITLTKITGFLHDCGKPFVLRLLRKKNISQLFTEHTFKKALSSTIGTLRDTCWMW
ncbi:hypothetical protein CEXT_146731 [Caerostris extrusa]|uniref:Uncharacterized protein n=1 Tax=Caerostris extrusa TaxID=172846 RepID=A0AAV4VX47_CAEEX|nr:hypothetical protein CEXT_146731 [Caerostris extrusa]